ncbi:MAG: 2-dehydropantoate 2-reductase N-terminal domain-containing protein, partial [Tateyamaria sp.]
MTRPAIAVAGIGYVGLSNAVLLARHNSVTLVDIDPTRVAQINARTCPIVDPDIEAWLAEQPLDLSATTDGTAAYAGADIIIVATPTNYDPQTNFFDTSSVESVQKRAICGILADQPLCIARMRCAGHLRRVNDVVGHATALAFEAGRG